MDKQKMISIGEYPAIKRLYDKAVKEGKEVFQYDGCDILTSYAKYLLEYMEMKMRRR
jgi:hypothetical protein